MKKHIKKFTEGTVIQDMNEFVWHIKNKHWFMWENIPKHYSMMRHYPYFVIEGIIDKKLLKVAILNPEYKNKALQ